MEATVAIYKADYAHIKTTTHEHKVYGEKFYSEVLETLYELGYDLDIYFETDPSAEAMKFKEYYDAIVIPF